MIKAKFVVFYLIPMIITYVCSWMGSTSATTAHFNPNYWAIFSIHIACYVVMIISCLKYTKEKWISIFPILAIVFDMIPIINFIPFIPTILNLIGIITGVKNIKPSITIINDNRNIKVGQGGQYAENNSKIGDNHSLNIKL